MDRDHQIALVEASFERVKTHKSDFVGEFYTQLFETHPQIKPLFATIDTRAQGAKLYASLALLIQNLRQPDALERVLLPLGKKHIGYGATPEHYLMMEQTIISSLKSSVGDDWTPELQKAWAITLRQVVEIMLQGADMTLPNGDDKITAGKRAYSLVTDWLEPDLMELVEDSFARIKVDKQAFTQSFYNTLFDQNPQLKPLFASTNMKKQGSKLYATLV